MRTSALFAIVAMSCAVAIADEAAKTEIPLNDTDREHWAFVPPVSSELPKVQDAAWCLTSIDRFILAKLEEAKLQPASPADAATLLRRVTFDLTGLPPTAEQIESGESYDAVVDRLLASRAYAERQAQHWLDLARYADSDGYEHDIARPEAWRYRDWVIDAFDRDMPIDEFIRLQIAGDVLKPDDPQAAIATGFLLCGPDMPDLNRQDERRSMLLNEMTGAVGSTLLALQIGCAECHDHKFEPISQADFYRLRACFETSDFMSKGRKEEGDENDDAKSDGRRVFHERSGPFEPSHLLVRGDFQRPGAIVDAGFPRVANPQQVKLEGDSRRAALADWLTRPGHPLTARVLVNRIWQQHFGRGIVGTPSDFGYLGDTPTHPELLDWLATELVRDGWSLKRLHRLIVTSAAYGQAGAKPQANDPTNSLLSCFPRQRLDGEAIRDAMLASAGRLSSRRGGPGVMPPLPTELLGTIRKDHWKVADDEENWRRRSVYLFVRRNLRIPLFEAFDKPDTMASCPRRNRSTTAPQALVLLNSEFAQGAAVDLARHARETASENPHEQARFLYLNTLGRAPTQAELDDAVKLIRTDDEGLVDLCLALFNLNEFVYVD